MGLFINTDAHTFFNTDRDDWDARGVEADIDFYTARGGVEAMLFNMNFQRCYWRSHSRDAIWDGLEERGGKVYFHGDEIPEVPRVTRNARALSERCPEFFELRYRLCHERGVEMWHSVRMNDAHGTTEPRANPQLSDLWRTRPDLLRCDYRRPFTGCWQSHTLDYGKAEVREYNLALIREYLEHECDGVELDWMRTLPIFAPGMEEPMRPVLTGFMRDVRAACDEAAARFGHPVRLAHRVPLTPDETFRSGLDVFLWAAEGLADVVIPAPAYATSNALQAQTELWRRLLPASARLVPCLEWDVKSRADVNPYTSLSQQADAATDAGFASSFYHAGADGIYLYNHFRNNGGFKDQESMRDAFSWLGDPAKVAARPRRHLATFHDSVSWCEGRWTVHDLPEAAWERSVVAFPIDAGGATAGRRAVVVLGAARPIPEVDIRLNGVPCARLPEGAPLPTLPTHPDGAAYATFEPPAGVLHDGRNTIDILNLSDKGFVPYWGEIWLP